MAKEPYKDPFANLPRRVCGVVVDGSGERQKTRVELAEALQTPTQASKAASNRGPKKGTGGRPKKSGMVSKRTQRGKKKT